MPVFKFSLYERCCYTLLGYLQGDFLWGVISADEYPGALYARMVVGIGQSTLPATCSPVSLSDDVYSRLCARAAGCLAY